MWTHPGKKLLFMGCEFAQGREWNHAQALDWALLDYPQHRGMQAWIRDLNRVYRTEPALYRHDCRPEGFRWIDADAADLSLYTFLRFGDAGDPALAVLCNFTPVQRVWTTGLPAGGAWEVLLSSEEPLYGGQGGGESRVTARAQPHQNLDYSTDVTLLPLSVTILKQKV